MKSTLMAFIILSCVTAFAGPSPGGGVPEAPWVASQQVFGKVMKYMEDNRLTPAFIKDNFDGTVSAGIVCNGKTTQLLFRVERKCEPTAPGFCIPLRTVTLDQERSEVCR